MGETFTAYDVVSVGIECEVDGRIEKSIGIAKVSCFFYDDNGNLKINLFWYYSPEDANITGKKRSRDEKEAVLPQFHERELLASKHVDVVPVEAIEGRAYVLSFSEYNRFIADCASDSFPEHVRKRRDQICPLTMDDYPNERALPAELSPDSVYFSRYAYNFAHHRLFVGPAFKKFQPWGRTKKAKSTLPNRAF
uniref:BAH domain-containing protein n=1 Tax=Steinernema glaseri TaxID=37863 RepID=A0A1I7YUP9_9BILA